MAVAIFTHPACLEHRNAPQHPECPERLNVILSELRQPAFHELIWLEAPQAEIKKISPVHNPDYLSYLHDHTPAASGYFALDGDTALSKGSYKAALYAAGAGIAAVDTVFSSHIKKAFCAVRPPGHHALSNRAMGFCLINNIAVAAAYALERYRLKRVAIIDFDVHHGNGTEAWTLSQPDVLYCSSHQYPCFPGTGFSTTRGTYNNIINVPLPATTNGQLFRLKISEEILPALHNHAPELILISAGFDAHQNDPLANLNLTENDFGWITHQLCDVANQYAQGRVISSLEGGYNLEALAKSVSAHVQALMSAKSL